jgi:sulfate adenylyltransferase
MIKPHGAAALKPLFVDDPVRHRELRAEAETLPSLLLNSAAAANAVMLGAGYFTPLDGFMDVAEAMSVARDMRTSNGLFWPIPVLNLTHDISGIAGAGRIALRDPNIDGNPVLAVMDVTSVESFSAEQIEIVISEVYGTADEGHPGVTVFRNLGSYCIAGKIEVLNFSYFGEEFTDTFRTAVQIREEIRNCEWHKVVAFQTRNPMHLAHEELCRIAQERTGADGIVIHMLLGRLKQGDIPAPVRNDCIRKMVDVYFPENSVLVSGYGFDMLYAGPREALLHAVFRQNMGATHLIVGRDHAGVGDYYGAFDAQEIFEQIPRDALEIEIFGADHTAWSRKLNRVVMMREAENHSPDDYLFLSGTRLREMLSQGIAPPPEFTRPEVAKILMEHYQLDSRQ